jgi:hypothetical protein
MPVKVFHFQTATSAAGGVSPLPQGPPGSNPPETGVLSSAETGDV